MLGCLITSSLDAGDCTFLNKVKPELLNSLEKKVVDWIADYSSRYSCPPTLDRFCLESDNAIFVDKTYLGSPLQDVFEKTVEHLVSRSAKNCLEDALADYVLTREIPIDSVQAHMRFLSSAKSYDAPSIFDLDRDKLYTPNDTAFEFGFSSIDHVTGGVQNGEYVVLSGRPGNGKTLLACALAVHWAKMGKRVLVISREMTITQLSQRIDALVGKFNPKDLRISKTAADLDRMKDAVRNGLAPIKAIGGDIIIPSTSTSSVRAICARIEECNPDIVVIDGIYLLSSENASKSWERVKDVSNDIKSTICIDKSLPVFATTQIKRTDGSASYQLDDIAYSDAIGQDADIVMSIQSNGPTTELDVNIIKNRYGESLGTATIAVDWHVMDLTEQAWTTSKIVLGSSK